MSLPADYHMHTPLCRHAKGEPTEYAARALELGLPEIGFSDHSPVEHDDQDDWRMLACELNEYVAKVEHAREAHPSLPIRLGLEVDFIPGHEPWIKEMARRHDWDYFVVLGLSGRSDRHDRRTLDHYREQRASDWVVEDAASFRAGSGGRDVCRGGTCVFERLRYRTHGQAVDVFVQPGIGSGIALL